MLLSAVPATPSDEIRISKSVLPEGEVTILPAAIDSDEVFTILPFPGPGDDAFTFGPGVDGGEDGIVTILPFPLPDNGEVSILPFPLPGEGPAVCGFANEDAAGKPIPSGPLGMAPADGAEVTISYGAVPLEIVQFAGLADLFASLNWHV